MNNRELDVQLERLVFGSAVQWSYPGPGVPDATMDRHPYRVPQYSTDMGDAWKLVQKLNPSLFILRRDGDRWTCYMDTEELTEDTPMRAICMTAWLLAERRGL